MLPLRKRWHIAKQQDPLREARLLWFANGNTPNNPNALSGPSNNPNAQRMNAAQQFIVDTVRDHLNTAFTGNALRLELPQRLETYGDAIMEKIESGKATIDEMTLSTGVQIAQQFVDTLHVDERSEYIKVLFHDVSRSALRPDVIQYTTRLQMRAAQAFRQLMTRMQQDLADLATQNHTITPDEIIAAYIASHADQTGARDLLTDPQWRGIFTVSTAKAQEAAIAQAAQVAQTEAQTQADSAEQARLAAEEEQRKGVLIAEAIELAKAHTHDLLPREVFGNFVMNHSGADFKILTKNQNEFLQKIHETQTESVKKVNKQKIEELLANSKEIKSKSAECQKQINNILSKKDKILQTKNEKIKEILEKVLDGLKLYEADFSAMQTEIMKHVDRMQTITSWDAGDLQPMELQSTIRETWKDEETANILENKISNTSGKRIPDADDIFQQNTAGYYPDLNPDSNAPEQFWDTSMDSSRHPIIKQFHAIMGSGAHIDEMEASLNEFSEVLENYEKNIKFVNELSQKIEEAKKKDKELEEKEVKKGGVLSAVWDSVEFYSLHDIYKGAKDWYEAFSYERKSIRKRREAKVARGFGQALAWLPFDGAEGALETVEQNVDKENDEEKDKYYKYIKGWGYGYKQLFDTGGVFDQNFKNPNRVRAILDFAAEKGYLYRVDAELDKERPDRMFFGHTMQELFGDIWPGKKGTERMNQYYKKLMSSQRTGERDQKESGAKQVGEKATIDEIMHEMIKELEGGNLWKVIGMTEKAMGKGKIGEVSGWLTTAILRSFRKSPFLNNIVVRAFFEQVGMPGLGHPGQTLNLIKGDQEGLLAHAGTDFENAGMVGELITTIENEFIAKGAKINLESDKDLKKLDHMVARVLACQTVEIGEKSGKFVSIFEDNPVYNKYRAMLTSEVYVKNLNLNADEDFYGGAETEVLLISPSQVKVLIAIENNGSAKHESKAANFLKLVINRYDNLKKTMPSTLPVFAKEMSNKLTDHIAVMLRQPNADGLLKLSAQTDIAGKREYLLAGLFKRHILDQSLLEPFRDKEGTLGAGIWSQVHGKLNAPNIAPATQPSNKKKKPAQANPQTAI